MTFIKHHKHHFGALAVLVIIAGVSWYFAFGTPDANDRIQVSDDTIQDTSNKIQTNEKTQKAINKTQITRDEKNQDVNNTIHNTENKLRVTSYELQEQGQEQKKQSETTLRINDGEFTSLISATTTVYDLMVKLKSENKISFTGKEYSGMGFFVDEINGVKNDNLAGKYWIYYINGQTAQVGISNYVIKPNDLIEWKYGKTNL